MTADASLRETLERDVAQHLAIAQKREIVRSAIRLMCWSGVTVALVVSTLFHRAGWIPPNTYLLTGEYGLFSRGVSEFYLLGATVILIMQFLRFRTGVHGDARSERIANYAGIGISTALFVGFVVLVVAFFGYFAHVWREGGEGAPSAITSAAIGIAIVAGVFAVAYLTRKKPWRITVEDDMPFGFVQRAMAILIGLPVAALFGFAMSFLALISLERAGSNVEPLRAFFNAHTAWFVVLTTAGFLMLSGLVHAARRVLRPQSVPVFIGTMLGTGTAIVVAKFAFLILVGIK